MLFNKIVAYKQVRAHGNGYCITISIEEMKGLELEVGDTIGVEIYAKSDVRE